MRQRPSPNFDARPAGRAIDSLVLHYTGMPTAAAALDRLCDPAARVSAHYLVEEDGAVWSLVPEPARAWHAGRSFWRSEGDLNDRSIGIEIVNPGHEFGYRPFSAAQMAAVTSLCLAILDRHPIPPSNVVAHSDIAWDRKQDPGELFDWTGLARAGVGRWFDAAALAGPAPAAALDLRQGLAAIGYLVPAGDCSGVIRAFQRHFHPTAVTGLPDPETLRRIATLSLGS